MTGTMVIEVPLPEALAGGDDAALIEALRRAVVSLRDEKGGEWAKVARKLETEGWKVDWGLTWTAEARRGEQHELALGDTRNEAFAQLYQLTMLDTVEGCP